MIGDIFHSVFFQPLYNALVFLVDFLPFHNLGIAIILLTLAVRLLLFPLQHKSVVTQRKMKEIEPQISKIKEQYKNNREEQAKQTMQLYKEHGVNPFSGFFMLILQFPILIALFLVLREGIVLRPEDIYSFVNFPSEVKTIFLGFVNLSEPSYFFAISAGVSQFLQIQLSMPKMAGQKQGDPGKKRSFGEELQKSMAIQTKYIMPVFIGFIATRFSSGLALYWTASNIFAIVHEIIVAKKAKQQYGAGTSSNNKRDNRKSSSESAH